MDNKTIFVRTTKGEEESQNRTTHLPGDVKRALLMVDGIATFGEISKRSAPSMRANLGEMLEELEKAGLIQDKSFVGKIPKMAIPHNKPQPEGNGEELDFMSGFTATPAQAPVGDAAKSEKLKAEGEEKSSHEIEAEKIKAQQEAEAILQKAEQEARRVREELDAAKLKAEQEARLRLEAVEREKKEAEAARIKAEQEAMRVREELEAAKLKAEQEARLRLEAAEREKNEAEAARIKAEEEVKKAREEAELKVKMSSEADRPMNHATVTTTRSISATVLFFDVVGYTKQSVSKQIEIKRQFNQIVSGCLESYGSNEHIILDTGDGAAIGFLQHPEDALEVAIKFLETIMANSHHDYPDLKVRIGIHFGPINIEKDMNGRSNMVGDGINDAQRVMSFAGSDRIYISRPYYDYISRLKDEYADMFRYRGMQKDKHGREHRVYELIYITSAAGTRLQANEQDEEIQNPFSFDSFQFDQPADDVHAGKQPAKNDSSAEAATAAGKQDTFVIDLLNIDEQQPKDGLNINQQPVQKTGLPGETAHATQPPDVRQPVKQQVSPPGESKPGKEQLERKSQEHIAEEARAKQMADAQAKVWAEAEQRALEASRANAERVAHRAEHPPKKSSRAEKPVSVARIRRKPFAWGKLVGFVVKLGIFLLVLLVGALFVVPYVLPMRDYMPKVQQLLSDRLHQPVHLGYLSGRILPMPRLDLGEIYIGDAKQFQAATAQINFDIMGVFGDKKPIDSVDFQGVKVRGIGLPDAASWLQQLASDKPYPVSRMTISQGTLDADAFQLTGVEGELNFSPAGKFIQAKLRTDSGKYMLDINAAPHKKLLAAITVRNSALPLLPNWIFDELDAKGELSSDGLQINNFDAKMLGGTMQGNARISWRSGWHAEGALDAKKIIMENLNKLLDGNVDGSARFRMTSMGLAGLTDSAVLEGSFVSSNGIISGMDIVETARMRSTENLPGGRTHYDGIRGDITYADNVYHFKQVKVDAGVLNATASFDVTMQQLSGKMDVNLSMHDVSAPVELEMGGVIDSPTLRYAH